MNYILWNARNLGFSFSFVLLFNLVLVGLVASYLGLQQVYWLGALSPLLLIFVYSRKTAVSLELVVMACWFFYLVVLWGATTGFSMKMVAVKDYIIPTLCALVVMGVSFTESKLKSLYSLLRIIVFLQLPFLMHQYFFVARTTSGREFDWDLMSGTFGFNANGGGGNSAGLLLFICFFVVLVLSKIRSSVYTKFDLLALAACVTSILMMEVKIVVLLVFFILFSVLKKQDLLNPKRILMYFLCVVTFLIFVVVNYNSNFSSGAKEGRSNVEYLINMKESYFDEDVINYETAEVSRQAALNIWLAKNYEYGIDFNTLLGYGLTSSKFSNSNNSDAVVYASYINFASTQITVYLWDVGLVGVLIIAIFLLVKGCACFKKSPSFLYMNAFRSGKIFILLSCCIYPFYSSVLHINSVAYTLFLVMLALNFKKGDLR